MISFSVVPEPSRQGVELETVLKALAPRFEVDVLTIRTAEMGYVERYRRTRMLRVPVGSGDRVEQVEAFRRAVRRQLEGAEYDLIHFRSAYGGLPVCSLKEYLDCKLVYEVALCSSTEQGLVPQRVLDALETDERRCLKEADLVLVGSQCAANSLPAGEMSAPVAVIPPGVDIDTFDWEPGVPQKLQRLVYVGRLCPGRGIRPLLEGFRELLEYCEANLTLVGPVDEIFSTYLEDAITRLGIRSLVSLPGQVEHDEIPRILSMADVCLCPWSPGETNPLHGFPLKLFEYMACRKPVVAADSPVLRELLGPRPPVKLVEPDNASELASAMLQLVADDGTHSRLAEEGYNLVRDRFSAAASRRALLSAYETLFGSSANLWGHRRLEPRAVTGTHPSPTAGDHFHDTLPYTDGAFDLSVTPTGSRRPGLSSAGEQWTLLGPGSASHIPITEAEDRMNATTDPEFIAAGSLLGSEHSEEPPDTDPLGTGSMPDDPLDPDAGP